MDGKSKGFFAGWDLGYDPGFDGGFYAGIRYHLFGEFTLPTYRHVFGVPMASDVPEPASIVLIGLALVPAVVRRAGRK